jgi:hypothetical protein
VPPLAVRPAGSRGRRHLGPDALDRRLFRPVAVDARHEAEADPHPATELDPNGTS